jgi:hypothetical protein
VNILLLWTLFISLSDIGVSEVRVDWDADSFAERAKATVNKTGTESLSDTSLSQFFNMPTLPDQTEPAIVIDRHGKIIVWYLPDILEDRVVGIGSIKSSCLAFNLLLYISKI